MRATDIVKQSELKPASFDNSKPLSRGQRNIINLLSTKISERKVVTKEDIAKCYFDLISIDGTVTKWRDRWRWRKDENGKEVWNCRMEEFVYTINDHYIQQSALQWFKSNLGTCILKGKLLVIPVIEID